MCVEETKWNLRKDGRKNTSIAAAWVQKLEAEPESEEEKRTRLNYLKLLLFVLQRGRLIGIFKKQPPSGALQPFPQGLSILDMGNLMLEQDDTPTCGGDARCIPYVIELSNDLREFVASQEVPNFGVQMYYAWSSDEPVHKWLSFDEEKFPQFVLDKIKQLKEVQSDEKSTVVKNGCLTVKAGCDLTLIEKCGKKKVKSPQEIEKSQGRSFHTYMGLVGRMGNFSDKCGDDPDKCQRQDPRKGKCPRKNLQKQYFGTGAEAEEMPMEDDFANFVSGLGGLNPLNRPCFCPTPAAYPQYPEHYSKGGPQHFQDHQTPRMNYTYPSAGRTQPENYQWNSAENRPPSRPYNEEQCPESVKVQPMQSQRRTPSPRPKSNSPNRPNVDCPPQDDGGFYNQGGVCCCTSPPCTCPCPRSVSQPPTRKTPSATNIPGRGGMDPSATCTKQGAGGHRMNKEDLCAQGPGVGPSGTNRSGGGSRPGGRKKSPQIIHCFDRENPDPCLTQTISKLDSLDYPEDAEENVIPEDCVKTCFVNEQSAQPAFQRGNAPQREVYDPCQQQEVVHTPVCPAMSGMKQKPDGTSPSVGQRLRSPPSKRSPRTPSPQTSRPVCQAPQELPQEYRPVEQYAQSYPGRDGARPDQVCPRPQDVCGRPAAAPGAQQFQTGNQVEDLCAFLNKSPPKASEPSPAGLTGKPPQGRPGPYDVCGRPATAPCTLPSQTGNQIEDLCAFLNKSPPKASGPSPAGLTGKSAQGRPGTRDACARPPADPCKLPPQPSNQTENIYAFLDKFPPDVPGLTPPDYENVFRRPPADMCQPSSPHWNEPQNLYEFMDKFPPNAAGYAPAHFEDEGGEPAEDPCRPPSQTGNQIEDLCAFLNKSPPKAAGPSGVSSKAAQRRQGPYDVYGRPAAAPCAPPQQPTQIEDPCAFFNKSPPKTLEPSPAGLTGKPPQVRPGPYDAYGRPPCAQPSQTGNQIEDLCAFLNKSPPKPSEPSGKCPAGRPGSRDACARPAADPCRPPPQPSHQTENIYAFLDKYPPDVPGLTPPEYENVFRRPPPDICQPSSPHWNEPQNLYEFIDKFPPKAHGYAAATGKCPQAATGTSLMQGINQRNEAQREKCNQPGSRKPQHEVCPDAGAYRPPPVSGPKAANTESCPGGPPNRGKTVTLMTQQPLPSRQAGHPSQPCPQSYGTTGQVPCHADEEEEDECESSESAGDICPKISEATYAVPNASQRVPGRPQQAQSPKVQTYGPQMMIPGRPGRSETTRPNREPEMQSYASQRVIPGKTYGQETGLYREPNVQPSSTRKPGPGKPAEYSEDWDDMPSSASHLAKHGYGNESASSRESEKQSHSPGKASPGPGSRKESRKSREPEVQSCPPQKPPSPGKGSRQDQTAEEWAELASGFSEETSSGGSPKDDRTPTCFPLVWGRESPESEGPGQKETNVQNYNPPQRKIPGRTINQEQAPSCAQPGSSSQRIPPRTRPSQNILSRQKSSSRVYQSLTDTKPKSVRKSKPSLPKIEIRTNNNTATKPKIESKAKPNIKSETQMKIKPETRMKIKSEPNMKFKSESSTKFKSNSNMKMTCISMDLVFDIKRKIPQQIYFKEDQKGALGAMPGFCPPVQQNVPSFRGNPYVERSLAFESQIPMGKCSTPKEWARPFTRDDMPTCSTIIPTDPVCEYNEDGGQIQIDFYEDDEDDTIEYMPLCSLNADLSGGKFFNFPEVAPQNVQRPQEAFRPNRPPNQPGNPPGQRVLFQTFQEDDVFECYP